MIGALSFAASLGQASATIRKLVPNVVSNTAHDPLHLNLPAVGGPGDAGSVQPSSLDLFGALYLQAEMEQAGIIPVAEALAEQRATMPITSDEAAGRLERFASAMRTHWYDRQYRAQVFARIFGTGNAATNDQGSLVNHDFDRLLAALCNALVQTADPTPWNQSAVSGSAAIYAAGQDLLQNLSGRQFGNALLAASAIQEELQQSLDLLNDQGIQQAFLGRGLWDTLAKILGSNAPDISRLVHRGQCAQAIFHWLAQHSADFSSGGSINLNAQDPVVVAAAQWLQATGLNTTPAPVSAPTSVVAA